jgi:hypothetical protein
MILHLLQFYTMFLIHNAPTNNLLCPEFVNTAEENVAVPVACIVE